MWKEGKVIQFRGKVVVFHGVVEDGVDRLDQDTKLGEIDQTIGFLGSIAVH